MSQFSIDPEIRSVSARTANELQQLNRRRVQLNVQVPQPCKESCAIPRDCGYGIGSWGWLVAYLLILIALIVFWWVVLYSANPTWVQTNGATDSSKVLLWAVVLAFVVSLILVVFKIIYDKYMCKGLCE
jgi:hypothetical protein